MTPVVNQSRAYLYAVTAVILWSTVATAFKIALETISYDNFLLISTFVSTSLLALIIVINKEIKALFSVSFSQVLHSAILGFLNPFLYYLILFKAYELLPAQIAQPLNYTWPIVLTLLSVVVLKKKLSLITVPALLISFSGVLVFSFQSNQGYFASDPKGIVLALSSSVLWAVFWLANMKDSRPESHKLFLNFFFGLIYITIFILMFGNFSIPFNRSLCASVYAGFFEMGITFILWLSALKLSSSPEKISPLIFLSPVISFLFIAFVLGEEIMTSSVIGLILILSGVLVSKISFGKSGLQ